MALILLGALIPHNILGYALIQLPDLLLGIYRFLKKVIINHNTSLSYVPIATAQNNTELTSISTQDDSAETNDEKSIGNLIKKINEMSQKLQHQDQLINDIRRKGTFSWKSPTRLHL